MICTRARLGPIALALMLPLLLGPATIARAAAPSVAVIGVNNDGMDPWWGPAFDPGKAFADLLTDYLVNAKTLTIVDRAHIESVFNEQKFAQSGDFSQDQPVQLGHMLGANFLIVGRILQLDKVGGSDSAIGGKIFGDMDLGGVGTSSEKVQLHIGLQIIDSSTGRIVKAMRYDKTMSGTGFVLGDVSGSGLGGYQSKEFTSSVIGKLMIDAATTLSKKILAVSLDAPATPSVQAAIIGLQADIIILNKGSGDGVARGMYFNVTHAVETKDPASGRVLTTNIPSGVIQVTSVDKESCAARLVSGKAVVGDRALTQ